MRDATPEPHPNNAPGPFYVVHGCCTACDVPVAVAPSLFAYDNANHCFVKRQPVTSREHEMAFRAAWSAELQCIRYRGDNPQVLRRFAELGEPHLCDVSPPTEIRPVVRDLATFNAISPAHAGLSAYDLAGAYQDFVGERIQSGNQLRFMPIEGDEKTARFSYAWYEDNDHSVEFRVVNEPGWRWLVRHDSAALVGGRAVSLQIDDWLKRDRRFCDIRWYPADQWPHLEDWRDAPQ